MTDQISKIIIAVEHIIICSNFFSSQKNMQSFIPPIRTLMGPGPSDVHPRILDAMARPTIGHLDPAFVGMMDEVKEMLNMHSD
jgi:Serine-pyruvate aminotransferase/archaeal aspartate aminotransferase